jgi:lipopolysaccharide/colanic/teichoic acid biosynthesis glycosyltransferase
MHVPTPTSRTGKRVYLSLWDLFWAVVSPIVALYVRDVEILLQPDWTVVSYYWALSSGFALLAFFALRLQDGMTRYFSVHEALDIAEAVLLAQLMTCAALFTLTRLDGIPRSMPLIHGLILVAGLIAARLVVRIVLSPREESQNYHSRRERMILIGANRFASTFIQLLRAYDQRQSVIAVLDEDAKMVGRAISGVQVFGAPHELDSIISEFAIHGVDTNRVVIAGEADFLSPAVLNEVERICQKRQVEISFLPRMLGLTEWKESDGVVNAEPLQTEPPLPVPPFFRIKRGIDIIGSLALIVLLFPVFLIAGVLVLLDVGPPILFWQERLGWKGRSFLIYKFRTLRAPFDSAGNPTIVGREPSAIGRFLRATRIDELPQLLNVLLGDMSLIGPRPLLPEDQPSNTSVRLSVRPGITGWAQVNGAKLVTKDEKEKLDEFYILNASLAVDLRIALMTVKLMSRSRMSSAETVADVQQVRNRNTGPEPTAAHSGVTAESYRRKNVA